MNIYLCSRVAKDAHEMNNAVAKALRELGHSVFVPHEQHYNQIMAGTAHLVEDVTIYCQDMDAMLEAELCVVVGRVGVDCAFEVGWFQGAQVPTYWYKPVGPDYGRHPMLYAIPPYTDISALVAAIAKDLNTRTVGKLLYNKG